MKTYVESIKRLVANGELSTEKVDSLNILTEEEKEYIKTEAPSNEYKRAYEIVVGIKPIEGGE